MRFPRPQKMKFCFSIATTSERGSGRTFNKGKEVLYCKKKFLSISWCTCLYDFQVPQLIIENTSKSQDHFYFNWTRLLCLQIHTPYSEIIQWMIPPGARIPSRFINNKIYLSALHHEINPILKFRDTNTICIGSTNSMQQLILNSIKLYALFMQTQ